MENIFYVLTTYASGYEVALRPFFSEEDAAAFIRGDLCQEIDIEKSEMDRTEEDLAEKHDDDWRYASLAIRYDDEDDDLIEWRILEKSLDELLPGAGSGGVFKTLTMADDYGGGQIFTTTRLYLVPSADFDLMAAIKEATADFYASTGSAEVRHRNGNHELRFGDFDRYVPQETCVKHGFMKIGTYAAPDISRSTVILTNAELKKKQTV